MFADTPSDHRHYRALKLDFLRGNLRKILWKCRHIRKKARLNPSQSLLRSRRARFARSQFQAPRGVRQIQDVQMGIREARIDRRAV